MIAEDFLKLGWLKDYNRRHRDESDLAAMDMITGILDHLTMEAELTGRWSLIELPSKILGSAYRHITVRSFMGRMLI